MMRKVQAGGADSFPILAHTSTLGGSGKHVKVAVEEAFATKQWQNKCECV